MYWHHTCVVIATLHDMLHWVYKSVYKIHACPLRRHTSILITLWRHVHKVYNLCKVIREAKLNVEFYLTLSRILPTNKIFPIEFIFFVGNINFFNMRSQDKDIWRKFTRREKCHFRLSGKHLKQPILIRPWGSLMVCPVGLKCSYDGHGNNSHV